MFRRETGIVEFEPGDERDLGRRQSRPQQRDAGPPPAEAELSLAQLVPLPEPPEEPEDEQPAASSAAAAATPASASRCEDLTSAS